MNATAEYITTAASTATECSVSPISGYDRLPRAFFLGTALVSMHRSACSPLLGLLKATSPPPLFDGIDAATYVACGAAGAEVDTDTCTMSDIFFFVVFVVVRE